MALIKHRFRNSSLPPELYVWCNETTLKWATAATASALSSIYTTGSPTAANFATNMTFGQNYSDPFEYNPRNLKCLHPDSGWPYFRSGEPFDLLADESQCDKKHASREQLGDGKGRERTLVGRDCELTPNQFPEVFFFSLLLFIGTFALSWGLKAFKQSRYFRGMVCSRFKFESTTLQY